MQILNEARRLLQAGQVAAAEQAFARALEYAPNDAEALRVVGVGALRDGSTQKALELLERAAIVDPDDALTQHYLGCALDAAGDLLQAATAFRSAVTLNPQFYVARLHLGGVLGRLQQDDVALLQFSRALNDAQQQGRWLDPDTTPAGLRPLVERAVATVRTGRRRAFSSLLEPLVQKYGRDELLRVERCVRIYLREEEPRYFDPRQRPTFLYFPQLPAAPYFERSLFPWIEDFESRTGAIRSELFRLLAETAGRERVFTNAEVERHNLRGATDAPSWNGYYFYRYGERRADNCARCPQTIQALDSLPLAQIREHAPEIFFSVFTPGTHLLPHRGVTNTRVVAHLPLVVPADCALTVGGESRRWQEGSVVVFDDTYEHEAWNRSGEIRVVLIFDLWNPYLTPVERLAVAELVAAIGDMRKATETAG